MRRRQKLINRRPETARDNISIKKKKKKICARVVMTIKQPVFVHAASRRLSGSNIFVLCADYILVIHVETRKYVDEYVV